MPPYLTDGIPGTGGSIKESPEDFEVWEIPAYEPSGSGEHLFLMIEKRGITTLEAVRRVGKALRVPEKEIGYAGMKDAVGVTRQTISLPRVRPEDVLGRDLDGVLVLAAVRHVNKLKLGHLKGNRFRVRVRGVESWAGESLPAVLDLLSRRGVPNRFGSQRYGAQGNSHLIGRAMLKRDWREAVERLIGDPDCLVDESWRNAVAAFRSGDFEGSLRLMPRHCKTEKDLLVRLLSRPGAWERAFDAVHPRLKRLYLSAFQSSLFDLVVDHRLAGIDLVICGDLAWKHINGACFLVEDAAAAAPRAAEFEISATGPMFGPKMKHPGGEVLELERRILAESGISPDDLEPGKGLKVEGERRPLRVPLGDPRYSLEADVMTLEFSLPRGSYATSVLSEVMKTF